MNLKNTSIFPLKMEKKNRSTDVIFLKHTEHWSWANTALSPCQSSYDSTDLKLDQMNVFGVILESKRQPSSV
jgi:hypothetical protein